MITTQLLLILVTLFGYTRSQITLYDNRNPSRVDIVTTNIRRAVIEYMLDREYALKRYGPIEEWDTSQVTDMSFLFFYGRCPKNRTMPLCAYLLKNFNEDISAWDVSSVTNLESTFFNTHKFNVDISNWDTSNVQRMARSFYGTQAFNADISGWDVSSVTDSDSMFKGAKKFTRDLTSWTTSNISM